MQPDTRGSQPAWVQFRPGLPLGGGALEVSQLKGVRSLPAQPSWGRARGDGGPEQGQAGEQ